MARVTGAKTRQAILVLGATPDPYETPEHLELFDQYGDPINLSGSVGIPPGGTTDQILAKISDQAYDVEWVDLPPPPAGGGGGTGPLHVIGQAGEPPFVGGWANVGNGRVPAGYSQVLDSEPPSGFSAFLRTILRGVVKNNLASGSIATVMLSHNPNALWKLNETSGNWIDSAPGGIGNITPSVASGGYHVPGPVPNEYGYDFSGDDYAFMPVHTTGITFAYSWFMKLDTPGVSNGEMVLNSHIASGEEYWRVERHAAGTITGYIMKDGSSGTNAPFSTGAFAITDTNWHHVALQVVNLSPTNTVVKLWIDGVVRATANLAGQVKVAPHQPMISQVTTYSGGVKFTGQLSHIAVYNNGLTDAQIQAHAAAMNAGVHIFTLPVGARPLDQRYLPVTIDGGQGFVNVKPNGEVWAASVPVSHLSFDGAQFLAEQ